MDDRQLEAEIQEYLFEDDGRSPKAFTRRFSTKHHSLLRR